MTYGGLINDYLRLQGWPKFSYSRMVRFIQCQRAQIDLGHIDAAQGDSLVDVSDQGIAD